MSLTPLDNPKKSIDTPTYVVSPKKAGIILGSGFIIVGFLLTFFAGIYPILIIREGGDPWWYDSQVAAAGLGAVIMGLVAFVGGDCFLKNWPDPDSEEEDENLSAWVYVILLGGGILIGLTWMWMDGIFEVYESRR